MTAYVGLATLEEWQALIAELEPQLAGRCPLSPVPAWFAGGSPAQLHALARMAVYHLISARIEELRRSVGRGPSKHEPQPATDKKSRRRRRQRWAAYAAKPKLSEEQRAAACAEIARLEPQLHDLGSETARLVALEAPLPNPDNRSPAALRLAELAFHDLTLAYPALDRSLLLPVDWFSDNPDTVERRLNETRTRRAKLAADVGPEALPVGLIVAFEAQLEAGRVRIAELEAERGRRLGILLAGDIGLALLDQAARRPRDDEDGV